ncbi:unnamed protein product [Ilex paraguariensis]|uniref:VQ domain-containing protein n=1 Tax=Ilex paraguariensis TaxID=185542 RepID=A0ABC8SKF7_9AQUA
MYTIEGIMKKQPCVPNTTTLALAMHKDSQTISKVKPKIHIIHIFAPKIFKTDASNFWELVQRLTGKPKEDCCTKKRARHPRKGVQNMFYKNSVTKKWTCVLGSLTGLDVDALMLKEKICGRANSEDLDEFMQELNGFSVKGEEEKWCGANLGGGFANLDSFMQKLNGFGNGEEEER